MKFVRKIFIIFILFLIILIGSCGKKKPKDVVINTKDSFALDYFDGMNIDNYDSSILWRNSSEVLNDGGGDSGVMWVDPEDDPIYGGYFYMYSSGSSFETVDGKSPTNFTGPLDHTAWILTCRSKDLVDWEICGSINNCFSMIVENSDEVWLQDYLFAPECTYCYNEVLGKMQYYLYFSARTKQNNSYLSSLGAYYDDEETENYFDRFYLSCAVADTPCGPFRLASSELVYGDPLQPNMNGKIINDINPVFMINEDCDEMWMTEEIINQGRDEAFCAIDISPFWDENGDLYIYFCRHFGKGGPDGSTIWGVKMKDPISPDYETLTMLLSSSYTPSYQGTSWVNPNEQMTEYKKFVNVSYKGTTQCDPNYPRHLSTSYTRTTRYEDGTESDDPQREYNLIEAPSMLMSTDKDGNTIYCLMYSPIGVGDFNYNLKLSVGYSPLGPFTKINELDGATVLGVDGNVNDFMSNLGHDQVLTVDDEIWIVHWQQQAPFGGVDQGRLYALSKASLQYNDHLGMYLPVANGPTTSLQPLPSVATGYHNIAKDATIVATNVKGNSTKYLNDEMTVTRYTNQDKEFRADESTVITISFNSPQYVKGLMIYNSYTYANSFKNISQIIFDLAETPSWHNGNEKKCYIENLQYNTDAYKLNINEADLFQPGSSALATFNELYVNKITIVINKNDLIKPGNELRISDIVVLGSEESLEDKINQSDKYEWEYKRPFAGEPDSYMNIDGKLNETVWDECTYLTNTKNGITVRTRTYFTSKGLYLAMEGFSNDIRFEKRYTDRTAFHVIVTKTGETTYSDDSYETFGIDHAYRFDCDAYYARSFCRVPYYYAASVDGVLNSGNTKSLTSELFLTWEDLYYTEDQLNEYGTPDNIQIYVSFYGVEVLGTCSWRLETYPIYDADGFSTAEDNEDIGAVENGPGSTGMWFTDDRGYVSTDAGHTQITYVKEAFSSDYIFEATLEAHDGVYFRNNYIHGKMGLINMDYSGIYSIYMVESDDIIGNSQVHLYTAREIDSFHWINKVGIDEVVQNGGIKNQQIKLTVIKHGFNFYYFYNDNYYDMEILYDFSGSAWVGFYTTSGMSIIDYSYTDYQNNVNSLENIIESYVYKVTYTQKNSRGYTYCDKSSVKQGTPLTLHIRPSAGYVLSGLSLNGDSSFYDTVIQNLNENSDYIFIPTGSVNIESTFSPIPTNGLVDTVISFKDSQSNAALIDATYTLKSSNPLIYYEGMPNSRGNVITELLKAGTYSIAGKIIDFDGHYQIILKVKEHNDTIIDFVLNDDSTSISIEGKNESVKKDRSYTIIVKADEQPFGTVCVNDRTFNGYGTLQYDSTNDEYYVDHNGVFTYFKNMIGTVQKLNVSMQFKDLLNSEATDPISGVCISNSYVSLVLKINRVHSTDRLILAVGGVTGTSLEYAISGVPSLIGSNGGTFDFTLYHYNNKLYFVDAGGILKFVVSVNGIEFFNGAGTGWGWEDEGHVSNINDTYKSLFSKGDELVFGAVSYNNGGIVKWHFDYSEDAASIQTSVENALSNELSYRESRWVERNVANYVQWRATEDGTYTVGNPGDGGCYSAYIYQKTQVVENFQYTFKVNNQDFTKLAVGVAFASDTSGVRSGVNVSVRSGRLYIENFRYTTNGLNSWDCDWPYVDLEIPECIFDNEVYIRIKKVGNKTSIYIGDSVSSLVCYATFDQDHNRTPFDTNLPGLFVRGLCDSDNTSVTISEVELKFDVE